MLAKTLILTHLHEVGTAEGLIKASILVTKPCLDKRCSQVRLICRRRRTYRSGTRSHMLLQKMQGSGLLMKVEISGESGVISIQLLGSILKSLLINQGNILMGAIMEKILLLGEA